MITHCNIYILKGNCLVLSFLIQVITENAFSHVVLTISFNRFITFIKWSKNCNSHSHKKQEDILEGSLDQVLIPAELDFSKILIPRQFQHTSNVNIECARMVKTTVFFIRDQPFEALIHLNFIILILMFLIDDTWCKICNVWLLLCKNNSKSITIPERNTGGKYCSSYYSRQTYR